MPEGLPADLREDSHFPVQKTNSYQIHSQSREAPQLQGHRLSSAWFIHQQDYVSFNQTPKPLGFSNPIISMKETKAHIFHSQIEYTSLGYFFIIDYFLFSYFKADYSETACTHSTFHKQILYSKLALRTQKVYKSTSDTA